MKKLKEWLSLGKDFILFLVYLPLIIGGTLYQASHGDDDI